MAKRPAQFNGITPKSGPNKPVDQPPLPRVKGDKSDAIRGSKLNKGRKS